MGLVGLVAGMGSSVLDGFLSLYWRVLVYGA